MPKASIVIPTRNRAHLLKYALASALGQTYQDIEVVVSDNYCGNEETRKVCDCFDSPKLRYVRTNEPLSSPDSWEFALGHAQGEYITYLADDSYLFSDAIEAAVAQLERTGLEIAVWKLCGYYAPDWMEPHRRNLLYIPRSTFSLRVMTGEEGLKSLFDLQFGGPTPRFLNSLCHRRVVDIAIGAQKRLFWPYSPDYSAAVGVLQNVEKYLFLDWPLGMDGQTPTSIGASVRFNAGKAASEFIKEFKGGFNISHKLGLPILVESVLIAQTLQTAIEFYPGASKHEITKKKLVKETVKGTISLESRGKDMSEAWRTLEEYLAQQPFDVRCAAAKQKIRSRIRTAARCLRHLPFWEYLERFRSFYVFRGSQLGFNNIEECGRVAERLVGKFAGVNRMRGGRRSSRGLQDSELRRAERTSAAKRI